MKVSVLQIVYEYIPKIWDQDRLFIYWLELVLSEIDMAKVLVKEISSRLGNFCIVRVNDIYIVTSCDTRVKIIQALAEGDMTADRLAKVTKIAYSTVMDHMDMLEKAGIIKSFLKCDDGRRRICFRLIEKSR